MIWVLVYNNMYWYEHHVRSFFHNTAILEMVSIASKWVNTENRLIEMQQQGIILAPMCLC